VPDAASVLSAAEAAAIILAHTPRMPSERSPLASALGSVLASDLVARVDMPPWRASAMDGYAVRRADIARVPVRLSVVGDVAAGGAAARGIERGEAVRIATGAPVPDGADTVVRVEDTDAGRSSVEIRDARDAGAHVRPLGEDFRTGDRLLQAGDAISPATIGVIASAGIATVEVHRRPTVAIVGSGDELVMLEGFDAVLARRRIVSSNSYTLPALVRAMGVVPRDMGIVPDDPGALRARVEAARGCDLLVTTAGISVGEHDHTRRVMESLGAEIRFSRVRIRPGGPTTFGLLDGIPWIGLSGNPVSAMVTFELFVRPAILRMCGHDAVFRRTVPATLEEPIATPAPLTHFLRAVVTPDQERGYRARLTGTQSSGALMSMVLANALLVVPADRAHCNAGDVLSAMPLGPAPFTTDRFPA